MELKDIIYSVGLLLTFTVSIISLLINVKNRRNAMREHLYKEQMSYYLMLVKEFGILHVLFYEIKISEKLNDDLNCKIDNKLEDIHVLIDKYELITPDGILTKIHNTIMLSEDIHKRATDNLSLISGDLLNFHDLYFDLIEDMRDELGVDALSIENKKLHR